MSNGSNKHLSAVPTAQAGLSTPAHVAGERPASRKKDSARLVWDTKPRRAPNPKDIEFQTAEVVIPNPQYKGQLPLSFRDGLIGEEEIDKQKMNRLIWGDNLLAMQTQHWR